MNKYSVIIATMWKDVPSLQKMVSIYNESDWVGEILIVNNRNTIFNSLWLPEYKKIKMFTPQSNLFVNPSWRYAVQQAQYERVIIVNDDIVIKTNFNTLMQQVDAVLKSNVIIGFDESCFPQRDKYTGTKKEIKITEDKNKTQLYGFGVFMVLFAKDFYVPYQMKVWYGDMYLFRNLIPFTIKGTTVVTIMGTTTSTMATDLQPQKEKEKLYYQQNKNLFRHE